MTLSLAFSPLTAPASAAEDAATAPLRVTISGVTPGEIPTTRHGRIVITGSVRNTTKQTWRDVHVYPLTSYAPITSRADLADAATSDPTAVIGDRLVDIGRKVGALSPGESVRFRLRVPVSQLKISHAPGVYWLAVHALGSGRDGSDQVADGRARTFLPLVRKKFGQPAPVSLVLPLTGAVTRTTDGRISNTKALVRATAPGGRLDRLLDFARSSGSVPITWVVDPGLLDALQELVDGNAGMDLARAERTSTATPSPSESPTDGATDPTGPDDTDGAPGPTLTDADRAATKRWLDDWTTEARLDHVLALPYGNVDVSSVRARYRGLLDQAWQLTDEVMADLKLSAGHVVDPPDGYLRPAAAALLAHKTTVLLADHGRPHRAVSADGVDYVYTSSGAAAGGPRPGHRTSSLQLRQRILAEASLNVLQHRTQPMVVQLPDDWQVGSPGATTRFFAGFTVPWTTTTTVPDGPDGPERAESPTAPRLEWSPKAAATLLPSLNLAAARQVVRLADTTADLFTDDTDIARSLRVAALTATSAYARAEPVGARVDLNAADTWTRALLDDIEVEGTDFVVLSGGSGALTVAIHNGLDKAIKVGLRGRADDPRITFDAPSPIKLAAGSRATVRLHAHASTVGVHEVTLRAVTSADHAVGRPLVFSVRTSQIGRVFWMVLAGGMVLLVLLVARRVRQRIRARRAAS